MIKLKSTPDIRGLLLESIEREIEAKQQKSESDKIVLKSAREKLKEMEARV